MEGYPGFQIVLYKVDAGPADGIIEIKKGE